MGSAEASAVMELARLEGWLRGVAALNERGCIARTYRAWLIEGDGSERSRLDAVRAIYGTDEAPRTVRVEAWSAQVEAPLTLFCGVSRAVLVSRGEND